MLLAIFPILCLKQLKFRVSFDQVYEMDEEVERHRLIRESLELELQALRHRLSTVDNFPDTLAADNTYSSQNEDIIWFGILLSLLM